MNRLSSMFPSYPLQGSVLMAITDKSTGESGNALMVFKHQSAIVPLAKASRLRPDSLWEGTLERFGHRDHGCMQCTTPDV